ncbi:MAG: site-specific DNA-methyltransferase [Candidatus Micrarchaeaceae archaeon]
MTINKLTIYNMHVLDALKQITDNSIDCIVTSPPYYGLRFYGNEANAIWDADPNCQHDFSIAKPMDLIHENRNNRIGTQEEVAANPTGTTYIRKMHDESGLFCSKCGAWQGQLGLEPDYKMYLNHLLQITAELKRILKPTGTLWWNMGQTYAENKQGKTDKKVSDYVKDSQNNLHKFSQEGIADKSLMQLPERLSIRMVDEQGWILRNVMIWHKKSAMPSSVKDRLSNRYEYIYFFVKNRKYFFNLDAIRVPNKMTGVKPNSFNIRVRDAQKGRLQAKWGNLYKASEQEIDTYDEKHYKGKLTEFGDPESSGSPRARELRDNNTVGKMQLPLAGKNPGDILALGPEPYKEAHFAVFPTALPRFCIKAGCPEEGTVLDPFAGSGTTLQVALEMGLDAIGIEINPKYIPLIEKRTKAKERQHIGSLEYNIIVKL